MYLPVPILRDLWNEYTVSLSSRTIIVVRYGTGLIVYAYEIILYMARSLSMQNSIHIKKTSSKLFSWYQITCEDFRLYEL